MRSRACVSAEEQDGIDPCVRREPPEEARTSLPSACSSWVCSVCADDSPKGVTRIPASISAPFAEYRATPSE